MQVGGDITRLFENNLKLKLSVWKQIIEVELKRYETWQQEISKRKQADILFQDFDPVPAWAQHISS